METNPEPVISYWLFILLSDSIFLKFYSVSSGINNIKYL